MSMLMLTRTLGEKIIIHYPHTMEVIGEVLCLHRRGNQITFGLDFPRTWCVNREEIYNRMVEEKKSTGELITVHIDNTQNKLANRGC
jgi:carbon storage regulator CsrA